MARRLRPGPGNCSNRPSGEGTYPDPVEEAAMSGMIRGEEIHSDTVPTLVNEIHWKGESGSLVLRQDSLVKTLVFQKGVIAFATSNDRDDRLNQTILKRGLVSLPDLMDALDESFKSRQRLGAILLARKKITQTDLERVLQEQLKDIVFSVFAWTSGTWEFLEKPEAFNEKITIRAHPLELILEGVRRIPSWARVFEVVGGLNTEYRSTREAPALADNAQLIPGERQILTFCEAETRTLSEICDAVPLNDFVVCKVVWGLLIVGALMKA